MSRQNRVDPWGRIHGTPERGMFFGNRGCLHNGRGEIVRKIPPVNRWIICLTEFKNRKRPLLRPGRYTELFFLDEPTALAAGHRPCFECRREDAKAFGAALARARGRDHLSADAIDDILKPERKLAQDDPARRLSPDEFASLPDGGFVSDGKCCFVKKDENALPWSFAGYRAPMAAAALVSRPLWLVTPASTIAALSQGYRPAFHPSADGERA